MRLRLSLGRKRIFYMYLEPMGRVCWLQMLFSLAKADNGALQIPYLD